MRILVLVMQDFVPPESIEGLSDEEVAPWRTEYDVVSTLTDLGHRVRVLGVLDDLTVIRDAIEDFKPRIVFNLLEEFCGQRSYVPFVLGFLELLQRPYTGCNPLAMMITHDKGMMKKILKHHRIAVPDFAVVPRGRVARCPRRLSFPLIVKSNTEHGSVGIAQASVVDNEDKLKDRVELIHNQQGTDAIIEKYIEGREFYVGVIGNTRLRVLPMLELHLNGVPNGAPRIATERVKWNLAYQKQAKVQTKPPKDLPDSLRAHIERLCKRAYRILGLSGYARMDLRMDPDGKVYLLEPNPNPDLAWDDEFAEAANAVGIKYEKLLEIILGLGLRYKAGWKAQT
jgi:D-alanine-D-alanine ligase